MVSDVCQLLLENPVASFREYLSGEERGKRRFAIPLPSEASDVDHFTSHRPFKKFFSQHPELNPLSLTIVRHSKKCEHRFTFHSGMISQYDLIILFLTNCRIYLPSNQTWEILGWKREIHRTLSKITSIMIEMHDDHQLSIVNCQ
jgi:hypothetical protein